MKDGSPQHPAPPISSIPPWHWGWSAALAAIVVITAAFRYALPLRDGDIWFHMLYGKYFLEHHTLIADHTIFSWTPSDNDTIYCNWLPDIFLYLLHKTTGLVGLFAFRYACLAVLVLGCFLFARRLRVATHPMTWFFCLLAVIMAYTGIWEKPEILSFTLMTLTAWNWWHIRSQGDQAWKNCYLFPLIMLVWVNSHGGFIFGCIFLLLIWLGEMANTWLSRPGNALSPRLRKHLTIALTMAACSIFLTPYGFRYPWQLLHRLLHTEETLSSFGTIGAYRSPLDFEYAYGLILCADLAILLLGLLSLRNLKKMEWSSLLTNLTFALLYTRFYRTTFYWAPVFLFSALPLIAMNPVISPGWRHARLGSRLLPIMLLTFAISLSGFVLYKGYVYPEKYTWMGFGIGELINPVEEAAYIKKYFPRARIGNTYGQGAYLLWELWPDNKVFIDARHFPFQKWIEQYWTFAHGKNIKALIDQYPCDLWCIGLHEATVYSWFLASQDWKLAFCGKNSAVFVRNTIALPPGAPIFSPSIASSKSQLSGLDALSFAVNIQEWSVAEQILDGMRHNFIWPAQKEFTQKAEIFTAGMKAYHGQDYGRAVALLGSIYPEVIKNDRAYAVSLINLSAKAWEEQQGALARELNQKAWDIRPGYYVCLYNAGAMDWYDWRTLTSLKDATPPSKDGKKISEGDPDQWRLALQDFIKIAPRTHATTPYLEDAQAMLLGTFGNRPDLMLPP